MSIKLCKNYSKINKLVKKLEENFPDEEIKVKSCINMCKHCKSNPTADIDGKKVKKKSIKKFIKLLKSKI